MGAKRVLLVNPWIEDFSAYDQWIKPIVLLKMANWLKSNGVHVQLVDCLDRSIWGGKTRKWNSGKFRETRIEKPEVLLDIPRRFKIFGGTPDECTEIFTSIDTPDFIFSGIPITYWYPALSRLTRILRSIFPDARIVLGGNYVTLMEKHARENCEVDVILKTSGYHQLQEQLSRLLEIEGKGDLFHTLPDLSYYPRHNRTSALLTTQGCPFKCTYCAVPLLYRGIRRRRPENVVEEILYLAEKGVEDVAFFDDALLVDAKKYLKTILEKVIELKVPIRFHLPNAIHLRYVDDEIAELLMAANFKTIRLGLENIDPSYIDQTGGKASLSHLTRGIEALKKAGFGPEEVGAYVMFGAPGESYESILSTIEFLHMQRVRALLVTYSPVPGTPDFELFSREFPDIKKEPLLHNKVVVMYRKPGYQFLKNLADRLNLNLALS